MEPSDKSLQSTQKRTFTTKICPPEEFNYYEHATVILYSQQSDGLFLLLFSSSEDDMSFTTPNVKYEGFDAAIPFTAARAVISQTHGCLSPSILKKISEGLKFTKDDLIFTKNLIIPKIWESSHFKTWLKVLTHCECYHDEFDGHKFYLHDAGLVNTDELNSNLLELEIPLYFKWFKLEELVDLTEIKILWPLKEFVEVVDIAAHLKEKQAYDMLPLSKQNVYVLLICKTDSARIPEIDYFYDHLPALFLGIYKRNKETWLVYNAGRDEFPSDEVMKYAKVLTIPGSPASAHKDDDWLIKTRKWLEKFHNEFPKTRFFGVCFGEQIICHSIGGKSDSMVERKADPKFFIRKVENIELTPEFFNHKFMKKNVAKIPNVIRIVEAHGDEVVELPKDFVVYAKSASCNIEIIASKDERYFGIQSHPEFAKEYYLARATVLRAYYDKQILTKEYFEENYNKSLENLVSDEPLSRRICYDFIKYQPEHMGTTKQNAS